MGGTLMMALRKTIFWLHLVAGVVAGVVILIMSVTGVALAYEKQIIAFAERSFHAPPPSANAPRLPIESLLAKAREASSTNTLSSVTVRSAQHLPVEVSLGRDKMLLLNPYSGAVLGEGSQTVRAFMRLMIDWHRWLGMQGEQRPLGKAITGACNLAFLFLVISGFYLWFPRRWNIAALKSVTLFGRGLRGKARDWNWHNVIGSWSALPLLLIVATAVFFSYPWATTLLYRAMGNEPPPPRPAGEPAGARRANSERSREVKFEGLNVLFAQAEKQAADWKTITLRFGGAPSAPASFMIDRGNGGQPNKKIQLSLDRQTAAVVSTETYESYNVARKIRLWSRWIHTGEAGGTLGQAIALLASLGGTVLVWTGISLAVRRFFPHREVADAQPHQPATVAQQP